MNFIYKNWHVWQRHANFLLSNEDTKKLLSFGTTDEVVTYLFLNGGKEAARALNAYVKGIKYTIESIKETLCYKSNIKAIKAVYPDHWHLFAQELMIAANCERGLFQSGTGRLREAFIWSESKQGFDTWYDLNAAIEGHLTLT